MVESSKPPCKKYESKYAYNICIIFALHEKICVTVYTNVEGKKNRSALFSPCQKI